MQLAVTETVFSQCIIADYPFNGNANDATGNGNNGTVVNGAALTTGHDGTPNSAYFFDAVDDGIDVNDTLGNFGTGDYTLSCWIKTTSTATAARFISKRPTCVATGQWFNLGIRLGNIQFEAYNNNGWENVIGNITINDDQWHHIAVVRSGNTYTIYVDCLADGSFVTSSSFNMTNSAILKFGHDVCQTVSPNGKYTGSLDEIKIFDCALTTNEISALCSVSSQLCVIADYPFNGNANDVSGNGNNGTVVNGAALTTGLDGTPNSAFYFDAVDDGIDVNDTLGNFGTGDYTLSCWIKTTSTATAARFISKRPTCVAAGQWFNLGIRLGKIQFETYDNGYETVLGNIAINDDQWHHVAVVRSGNTYTIYVDCIADGSFVTSSSYNTTNSAILKFGHDVCQTVSPNGKYTGSLDEIKIFDCALNSGELGDLCNVTNSIASKNDKLELQMYPNPTTGLINITTALKDNNAIQYQIINTLGATAIANKATAKDFSIDVSTLPSGIYFIHLQSGTAQTVKRFVKE
jgi:hypothetical protein